MKELETLKKSQLIDKIVALSEQKEDKKEREKYQEKIINALLNKQPLSFEEKMLMVLDIYEKIEFKQNGEKVNYTRNIRNGWTTGHADDVEDALNKLLFFNKQNQSTTR